MVGGLCEKTALTNLLYWEPEDNTDVLDRHYVLDRPHQTPHTKGCDHLRSSWSVVVTHYQSTFHTTRMGNVYQPNRRAKLVPKLFLSNC